MRKSSLIHALGAASATVLVAMSSSATTQSNYAGVGCKVTSGTVAYPSNTGAIENNSASSYAVVECPVTKRATASIASGSRVIVRNRNPAADIQCTLYSMFTAIGGTGFEFFFDAGNMLPIFEGKPTFAYLFYGAVGSTQDDYYRLRCTIPNAPPPYTTTTSQVISYQVQETF